MLFTASDRLESLPEEFDVRAEFFPLRGLYRGKEYAGRAFFCNPTRALGSTTPWPSNWWIKTARCEDNEVEATAG